jgi:hypothetical protein
MSTFSNKFIFHHNNAILHTTVAVLEVFAETMRILLRLIRLMAVQNKPRTEGNKSTRKRAEGSNTSLLKTYRNRSVTQLGTHENTSVKMSS